MGVGVIIATLIIIVDFQYVIFNFIGLNLNTGNGKFTFVFLNMLAIGAALFSGIILPVASAIIDEVTKKFVFTLCSLVAYFYVIFATIYSLLVTLNQ